MNSNATDKHPLVAIFFPTLTSGGIEQSYLTLATGLIKKGYDIDVVVADNRGVFQQKVPNDARIIDLNAGRVLKSALPLIRYLRNQQPDFILSGHVHANITTVWCTKFAQVDTRTVIGVHSHLSRSYSDSKSIIKWLYPVTYQTADVVTAVSSGIAEDLAQHTNISCKDICITYNPVPVDKVRHFMRKGSPLDKLNISSKHVLFAAGRLVEAKGFDILIRAVHVLRQNDCDVSLVIAGDGPEEKKLIELTHTLGLGDYVYFLGYIENVYSHMNAADVFVLSSRWEGFAIVLVEAMATGTPVVATNCPSGPAEILNNGEYGELTPVEDHNQLAAAIQRTLNTSYDKSNLVQRARQFDVMPITEAYESAFTRC